MADDSTLWGDVWQGLEDLAYNAWYGTLSRNDQNRIARDVAASSPGTDPAQAVSDVSSYIAKYAPPENFGGIPIFPRVPGAGAFNVPIGGSLLNNLLYGTDNPNDDSILPTFDWAKLLALGFLILILVVVFLILAGHL